MSEITVKCERCGATATGKTKQEAESKVNHTAGLSRGIKCGDNYNQTIEVDSETHLPKNENDRRCVTCGQKVKRKK